MKIIEYNESYKDQVIKLILSIQQDEYSIPISIDDQPDLLTIPASYQTGNGNFWVALEDDVVIGTIALIDLGNQLTTLRKMFVSKEYRGTGLSNNLLDTLISWCKHKQVATIYLGTTSRFLAAHKFYEKNNFVSITKEALPHVFPLLAVDTVFYKYDVHS